VNIISILLPMINYMLIESDSTLAISSIGVLDQLGLEAR